MYERTEKRKERILEVLAKRQKDLTVVLNNIHDPHNVSAVLRSCDAFAVSGVHLYYTDTAFPALGKKSSASAKKWVEITRHKNANTMVAGLRDSGHQVLTTGFGPRAKALMDWDLTLPTAIVMGNEHDGVEDEIDALVPDQIYIPMQGMVQSLNVSVATAIILYEAFRQRRAKGMYNTPSLTQEEIQTRYDLWITR